MKIIVILKIKPLVNRPKSDKLRHILENILNKHEWIFKTYLFGLG
jgi:hypothetical protein